ncbi:hypothetical protein LSUE1_G007385 [Lachnellula suecica]|uniref:Ubiquitin-like domain-containing protein n=1 Tax=Lachnellula suecica TaxID=602035 RepID=A0A8T9C1L1_9HELO|nr:hypothetical protein LSUE1_G007385 [Lachnellula suecica]
MSFGYSISDALALVHLAWKTVEGARRAEVLSLHGVLEHLEFEMSNPDSLVNLAGQTRRKELQTHMSGCVTHLRTMDLILTKYNALGDEERSMKKLWQKIQFGNGEVMSLTELRLKISTYTTAITMSLNLLLLGSQGRVEKEIGRQGGDLEGIRESVNLVLAKLTSQSRGGSVRSSVMTDYSKDDKNFWRGFRRELVKAGYPSTVIHGHRKLIQDYIKELEDRRVLDDSRGRSCLSLATSSNAQHTNTLMSPKRTQHPLKKDEISSWVLSDFNIDDSNFSDFRSGPSTSTYVTGQKTHVLQSMPADGDEFSKTSLDKEFNPDLHPLHKPQDQVDSQAPTEDLAREPEPLSAVQMGKRPGVVSPFPGFPANTSEVDPESTQEREPGNLGPMEASQMPPDVVAMTDRLAFLEKLTLEQEKLLSNANQRQRKVDESQETSEVSEATRVPGAVIQHMQPLASAIISGQQNDKEQQDILEAMRAAEIRAALRPLNQNHNSTESQPKSAKGTTDSSGSEKQVMDPKAAARARQHALLSAEAKKQTIRFKDCVGRKFAFPYWLAKTWEGMESLVVDCFLHIDVIGPHVMDGHYDLEIQGEIILPQAWENTIEPDSDVQMLLWPMSEQRRTIYPPPPPRPRSLKPKPKKKSGTFFK